MNVLSLVRNRLRDTEKLLKIRKFFQQNTEIIFQRLAALIPIKISLKFVPKGSINNIPALVQIMAWRRPGDKPLSESMMVSLPTHICVTRPQWVNGLVQTCPVICLYWNMKNYISNHIKTWTLNHKPCAYFWRYNAHHTRVPCYWHGWALILAWMNNYIHHEVWDTIT